MKVFCTIYILLCFELVSGQTFNLDNKFSISIPEKTDWKISNESCEKSLCKYFQLRKDFRSPERKFSDVTFMYETTNKNIVIEHDINGCFGGHYYTPDTLNICGYLTHRWYGVNCDWLIEDSADNSIAGYSIDWIIELEENKYLRIEASYFTADKGELTLIEDELNALINNMKIYIRKPDDI